MLFGFFNKLVDFVVDVLFINKDFDVSGLQRWREDTGYLLIGKSLMSGLRDTRLTTDLLGLKIEQ